MRPRHRLVELDPEPRPLRRQHVPRLPDHRPHQQLGLEPATGPDRLQDQEVRHRQRQLDRRRPGDRPGVVVRRHLRPEPLGQHRHLARLQQPPDPPDARLHDPDAPGPEQRRELRLGRQPLPGRHRHRRRRRHPRQLERRIRRHRLLEPQGIIGRDPPRQPDRAGGGELSVRPDDQIRPVAHRLAQPPQEPLRPVEVAKRRLMPAEDRIRPRRIELQRRPPRLDHPRRRRRRRLGIVVEPRRVLARPRDRGSCSSAAARAPARPRAHAPAARAPCRRCPSRRSPAPRTPRSPSGPAAG